MNGNSNRFVFMAATMVMSAAAVYASETGPLMLAQIDAPFGAPRQLTVPPEFNSEAQPKPDAADSRQQSGESNTATVVPNGTSCPEGNPNTILSPPTAEPLIERPASSSLRTGAALGTGTGCPPAARDVTVPPLASGTSGYPEPFEPSTLNAPPNSR